MGTITVLDKPVVTLLSRQEFHLPAHFEGWSTDAPSDAETLVEFAGRTCFNSFGEDLNLPGGHKVINGRKGNTPYIKNILDSRHFSVTEHAVWSLLFEGISRSCSHEFVRHRHLSPSQLSQRYVDESNIAFVLPPEIEAGSEAYNWWYSGCDAALWHYQEILKVLEEKLKDLDIPATLKKKRARQAARSVLPNAAETKIVVTGNARAWRNFIELRGSIHADTEIRRLAVEVTRILKEEAPNLFMDAEIIPLDDGTEAVEVQYTKV